MLNILHILFHEEVSSNVYEVIRTVLFFFLQKNFTHTKSTNKHKKAQKTQKAQKAQKSTKKYKTEISDFHLDAHKKHNKAQNT